MSDKRYKAKLTLEEITTTTIPKNYDTPARTETKCEDLVSLLFFMNTLPEVESVIVSTLQQFKNSGE